MTTNMPPALARHYYEVRREFLARAGVAVTPWYRLTPAERAVTESEVTIFREAIRRADEEQAVLRSITDVVRKETAPTEAAEQPVEAEEDQSDGECDCPSCETVRAFLALLPRAQQNPTAPAEAPRPAKVTVAESPFSLGPLEEEITALQIRLNFDVYPKIRDDELLRRAAVAIAEDLKRIRRAPMSFVGTA
ncbi:hypothetical protein [Streptomyces sp. NPDC000880]